MKVYTVTGFKGHWPVGTAAVVVAENRREAKQLLVDALKSHGIELEWWDSEAPISKFLVEVDVEKAQAIILLDGDY